MILLIKVWGAHKNTGLDKIKFKLNSNEHLDAKRFIYSLINIFSKICSITIMIHKVYGWEKKWRNNLKTCCGGCAETEREERI